MSDPSQNQPYHYLAAATAAAVDNGFNQPPQQPAPSPELQPETTIIVAVSDDAPLTGEVIPPEAQTAPVPTVPQYPIGLIDFNEPIVVLDNSDYNDEEFDSPQIVTVLKGSLHPVVISFWKHGEQCIAQFDTDGVSSCGDYKIEQDLIYPVTRYVVIGRAGRSLVVDEELYASEDAARSESNLDDIAGVFPVVIEAPKVDEPVAEAAPVSDFHDGGVESEEQDDADATDPVPTDAPTEMYVAGRNRRVGEIVHAFRQNFGTRACRIVKMRRDSRKSLFLDPQDGNDPYWALNKNVRY